MSYTMRSMSGAVEDGAKDVNGILARILETSKNPPTLENAAASAFDD